MSDLGFGTYRDAHGELGEFLEWPIAVLMVQSSPLGTSRNDIARLATRLAGAVVALLGKAEK